MHEDQTFPKRERLQYGYEFRRVYERGRKWGDPLAALHVWEPPAAEPPAPRRVGIVTSRRVGNAVARNRVRRLLREAYRLNKHMLKDHVHLVIVARPPIRGQDFREVEAALLALCRRAGLVIN